MSTRKSMTFPIILALIFIMIVIYLFATIQQSQVTCQKTKTFDGDIRLIEDIVAVTDGKEIDSMSIVKTIILPEKYTQDDVHLKSIQYALDNTLEYLGKNVKYSFGEDRVIVKINVQKDEIVLLNNIDFLVNDDIQVKINSNTKSSDVITLSVGDNYTDGELMTRLKNNGYTCK